MIYIQQHPNEYICGATLSFLQNISNDAELLETADPNLPLLPRTPSLLRPQNAVLEVYAIYREFENLIPDAS
jgi:coatomer subunit beta